MNEGIRVLVAPIDWGLGHASRCVPIIQTLLENGAVPLICGSGDSLALLKREFPEEKFFNLPNFPITYPKSGRLTFHFARSFGKMKRFIEKEHRMLLELIDSEEVQAIISDNRYGVCHDSIPSVIITHQTSPRTGIFRPWTDRIVARYINQFDQCWIPDFPGPGGISGDLSRTNKIKTIVEHIGLLSRFSAKGSPIEKDIELLAIVSGPEKQRSVFESAMVNQLADTPGDHVLIRGSSAMPKKDYPGNVQVYDFSTSGETEALIDRSRFIVCRAGYSGIMDLIRKNRCALLVPTPGQREQEYLADQLATTGQFLIQSQDELDLSKAIDASEFLIPLIHKEDPARLKNTLENFLESVY